MKHLKPKKYLKNILLLAIIIALGFGLGMYAVKIKNKYSETIKAFIPSIKLATNQGLNKKKLPPVDNLLPESALTDNSENIIKENDSTDNPEQTLDKQIEEAIKRATEKNQQNREKEPFSFIVLGDTQAFAQNPPSGNFQKAIDSLRKQKFEMVFAVGDLIVDCQEKTACQKSYAEWKKIMDPFSSKVYAIVGNHDRTNGRIADSIWQEAFSNLPTNGPKNFSKQVYSFDFRNSHFVVLDTEKPAEDRVDAVQLAWLENDLKTHEKANTFVFYHEPAFSTREKRSAGKCLEADVKQRDALWEILARHKVKAVFNGHEHFFSRMQRDGVYQFTVGNTDAPIIDTPKPSLSEYAYPGNAYVRATVDGQKINIQLFATDGGLVNSFDFGE